MTYLKLPEINHEDYDYSLPAFKDFREPLIIRGGCKDTKAFKTWNLEFMKNNLKGCPINVFESLDDMQKSFTTKTMEINPYEIDKYIFRNTPPFYYIANGFIGDDFEHFDDLKNISEKYRKPGLVHDSGYNLFIGYETYTNSHIHVYSDFLVNIIKGKKIFYLWNLYDNESVLNEVFHDFHYHVKNFWQRDHSKMKIYKVVLNEGDSFILPPYWFHAVYTPGFAIMVAKIYKKKNSPMEFFSSSIDITKILPKLEGIYNIKLRNTEDKKESKLKYYFIIFFFKILINFIFLNTKKNKLK